MKCLAVSRHRSSFCKFMFGVTASRKTRAAITLHFGSRGRCGRPHPCVFICRLSCYSTLWWNFIIQIANRIILVTINFERVKISAAVGETEKLDAKPSTLERVIYCLNIIRPLYNRSDSSMQMFCKGV